MKIRTSNASNHVTLQGLETLVETPSAREVRPCEGCTTPCPCPRRSPTCGCACDAACPEAPRALSTEPDRYPIEPKVVPLVFALAELRETQPSWSCEGHVRADGEWIRPPQVWFYAELSVYADLIARHGRRNMEEVFLDIARAPDDERRQA